MIDELYAIWLRSLKKMLAVKLEMVVSILLPLFIIFVLGTGISSFSNFGFGNYSYTAFLGPGVIALWVISGALSSGHSLIEDKEGFIKEMLVAPISRLTIFIGMLFSGLVIFAGFFMTILVVAFLAYLKALSPATLLSTLLIVFLIAFGFFGFGLVIAAFFRKARTYELFSSGVSVFLIFASGVFFPLTNLPSWLKVLALANPFTYAVDALRGTMLGLSEFGILLDSVVLIAFAVIMMGVGSYAFKRMTAQ